MAGHSTVSTATSSTNVYNLPMSDHRIASELREAQAELALAANRIDRGDYPVSQWCDLEMLMAHLGKLAPEIGKRSKPPNQTSDQQ